MAFDAKTMSYDNSTYSLSFSNDTINVQLNLGSDGSVGNYNISPAGTSGAYNGVQYTAFVNGQHAINEHNLNDKRMSGFFSIDFYRPGTTDTLKITGGQYEDLPY